jgi:hypothetical protein
MWIDVFGLNGCTSPDRRRFAERLFSSDRFGIGSRLFGNSAARGTHGLLNVPQRIFKIGWSTAQNSAHEWGYQLRIGIGKVINSNIARFHLNIPGTFVPNNIGNPIITAIRKAFGL